MLLRVSQALGLLFACVIGFGFGQYGPGVFVSVQDLYRVQTPAERREAAAKSLKQYVTSPNFDAMSEEIRGAFEIRQAEFDKAKSIGESYRLPQ